ncbi:MAG: hypothetical protein KatS3mg097_194 [Candidatus Parcubacteria bacterium]|nr:MAG: hypothetical protein KatS3mg097_194 [Candidatus Parcubacteria bacterium]
MIFSLATIVFLQPFFSLLVICLAPILREFLFFRSEKFIFKLLIFTLLTDLFFIKNFGFFSLIVSLVLFIMVLLDKFINNSFFYQRVFFIFIFNIIFFIIFVYAMNYPFDISLWFKLIFANFIFQLLYLEISRIFL